MVLIPTITVTDEHIPFLQGQVYTATEKGITLSGLIGPLIGAALNGKEFDATLTLTVGDDGGLTENIVFHNDIPFLTKLLPAVTENEKLPPEVGDGIKALGLDGASITLKVTFVKA